MDRAVILTEKNWRVNKKYSGLEITFQVRVDPDLLPNSIRDNPIVSTVESVRRLFQILIERCTSDLLPTDLIRICIQSPGLDKPISTCIMTVSTLTVEKLLATVMKVLQSKEEIYIDENFLVDVTTIRRDVGAGRRRIYNIDLDRLKKRSILSIPFDDEGLCCAKAIVFGLAHLRNDRRAINALKNRRRSTLTNRAR